MIYGDILNSFNELKRRAIYFRAEKRTVAGWQGRVNLDNVVGVLEYIRESEIENTSYALKDSDNIVLWTKAELKTGNYLEFSDKTFRILGDRKRHFEAGFGRYSLEEVVGNTDKQTQDEAVDYGIKDYE